MAAQEDLCRIHEEGVNEINDISDNTQFLDWTHRNGPLAELVSLKYPREQGPTITDTFITCRMVPHGGCFPSVIFAKASNCSIDFDYYLKKNLNIN